MDHSLPYWHLAGPDWTEAWWFHWSGSFAVSHSNGVQVICNLLETCPSSFLPVTSDLFGPAIKSSRFKILPSSCMRSPQTGFGQWMKRCNGISAWNKRTTEPKASKASKASVRHQRLQGSAPLAAKLGSQISAPLDESNVQVFPRLQASNLDQSPFFSSTLSQTKLVAKLLTMTFQDPKKDLQLTQWSHRCTMRSAIGSDWFLPSRWGAWHIWRCKG